MRATFLFLLVLGFLGCRSGRIGEPTGPLDAERPEEADASEVWTYLESKYDRDGDAAISAAEYDRDPRRFQRMDRDRDGRLTAADFQRGSSTGTPAARRDMMVARMTLMRYFQSDDDNMDLRKEEVRASFERIDADGSGRIDKEELDVAMKAVDATREEGTARMRRDPHAALARAAGTSLDPIEKFFDRFDRRKEGVWRMRGRRGGGGRAMSGVAAGEPAPDFTLRPPEGGSPVTLSSLRGKPVALIFGSYT